MDWKRALARMALRGVRRADRLRAGIGSRERDRPVHVVPYRGYGTPGRIRVRGRVLYGPPVPPASPGDSSWINLTRTYRHLESNEVPGAKVRIHFHDAVIDAIADPEGHISAEFEPQRHLPPERFWHPARIELVDPPGPDATAPIAVPDSPRFGLISDLDDTVLKTDVRNLVRMAREILFGNAHTRIPFPGIGAFYRALHDGHNPLFYVSSSPWNLYDVLEQFLQLHRIPPGPMELRDWGLSREQMAPAGHHAHKRAAIDRILATYPDLPFILVGDSGQEDPEIYRGVVHDHPERILAIYIRSVVPDPRRIDDVRALTAELAEHHIDLVLADDTLHAARHAAQRGWIAPEAIRAVGRDRDREERTHAG